LLWTAFSFSFRTTRYLRIETSVRQPSNNNYTQTSMIDSVDFSSTETAFASAWGMTALFFNGLVASGRMVVFSAHNLFEHGADYICYGRSRFLTTFDSAAALGRHNEVAARFVGFIFAWRFL
jgi:hypothetical protein